MSDVAVVRRATEEDPAGIGDVHASAWQSAYGDVFDAAFLERAVEGRRAGWAFSLPRILAGAEVVLVAERDDDVVAFAHGGAIHDGRPMAEIFAFYAHPSVWGTDVATTLMAMTCAQLAVDWQKAVLWTLDRAGRAQTFYEKAGFTATGNTRMEAFTDWTSNDSVERQIMEFARDL